jgi:platelet-activating factor acetylhydrolase
MSSIFWKSIRRWKIRYWVLAFVVIYTLYCWLHGMPLLSTNLPPYTGEYDVGTIDIETPVTPARRIGKVLNKDFDGPAFQLDTVLFSLFYPAVKGETTTRDKHLWVPKPISLTAEGYARFAHINNRLTNKLFTVGLWSLVGRNVVPAEVDAKLHGTAQSSADYKDTAEMPNDDYGLPKFPVIIFSHGMASGRTSYTQYCGELASRGFIVAAIEHRDGSGPGSILMRNNTTKSLYHFDKEQLEPSPETPELKELQLAMRQAEVEETVNVLKRINDGAGFSIFRDNPRAEGSVLADWSNRFDLDRIVVAGHSYGATLALQALRGAPSKELPFIGGIILDPGKSSGPLNDDIKVPIVIVHSQSWSSKISIFQGSPHFDVVKKLVQKVAARNLYAWFLTAKGTTHPSCTDAPLIEPTLLAWTTGATINNKDGIAQYVKVSSDFMYYLASGHRKGVLKEEVSHPAYDEEIREIENHDVRKFWQVHVAPSAGCPYPGLCGIDSD